MLSGFIQNKYIDIFLKPHILSTLILSQNKNSKFKKMPTEIG